MAARFRPAAPIGRVVWRTPVQQVIRDLTVPVPNPVPRRERRAAERAAKRARKSPTL